jgi:hypothetical protein
MSDVTTDAAVDRRALMRTYAEPPVTFVRGAGTMLYDAAGREYLDFITGLAVVSLGHSHPEVAEAVATQARTLSHVSNLYGNTIGPEVALTIDRLINGGTRAPRPTSAHSSWPGAGPGRAPTGTRTRRAGTSSSAPTTRSTGGRWPP